MINPKFRAASFGSKKADLSIKIKGVVGGNLIWWGPNRFHLLSPAQPYLNVIQYYSITSCSVRNTNTYDNGKIGQMPWQSSNKPPGHPLPHHGEYQSVREN
jgi:hypothetical protein